MASHEQAPASWKDALSAASKAIWAPVPAGREVQPVTRAEQLWALAVELGLTRQAAERAHRTYLQHLACAAWRDGILTDSERADLLAVASLLGVANGEAEAILEQADAQPAPSLDALPAALPIALGDRPRAAVMALTAPAAGIKPAARTVGRGAVLAGRSP